MRREGLNQLFPTKYCIICFRCAFASLLKQFFFWTKAAANPWQIESIGIYPWQSYVYSTGGPSVKVETL